MKTSCLIFYSLIIYYASKLEVAKWLLWVIKVKVLEKKSTRLKVFSGHKLKLRDTEWLIKAFMTQSRLGSLF